VAQADPGAPKRATKRTASASTGGKKPAAKATIGESVSASATGPLPTLRIVETRVLRGANYWA